MITLDANVKFRPSEPAQWYYFFLYSNLSGIELAAYEEEGLCALFKNENSIVRIENSLREEKKKQHAPV
jgi:hypothetical protein